MQSPTGPNFGRYQILEEIGRGAMGVVYKARDPKIDRIVAIKTIALSEHASAEEKEFRERFFLEARAAGRLSHPSIVAVHDVGEDAENQNPFIVMEYVEGESLDQQFSAREGSYDPDDGLSLIQDLAGALDYAHSQGIVHRDIKPANILLTPEGRPKITDFGVAKLNMAYQTVAGQSLGTPAYMSPEQLNGDPVDGRSDLFSLGVILYTLLTGHRPFQGNSAMTVSFRVVHREPLPVSAYDSDFPPDVDYVIGRAMAKDAAHRYQTGKEMADDLDDLRQGRPPRSKEQSGSLVVPAEGALPSPQTTQRFRSLKSKGTGAVQPTNRSARRWSMWEYAALTLLSMGVAAMGITMFRPAASADLGIVSAQIPDPALLVKTNRAANVTTAPLKERLPSAQTVAPSNHATVSGLSFVPKSGSTLEPTAAQRSIANLAPEPVRGSGNSSLSSTTPQKTASLHIRVEHGFPSAQVLIWVDDQLAYQESSDGTVKRRMGLFKTVKGYKSDSIPLTSGEHKIRVRVQSTDDSYDRTATIKGMVPANAERALKVDCTNRKQIHLTME